MIDSCARRENRVPAPVEQTRQQLVLRDRDMRFGALAAPDTVARSLPCGNRLDGLGLHTPIEAGPLVIRRAVTGYVRC